MLVFGYSTGGCQGRSLGRALPRPRGDDPWHDVHELHDVH